MYFSEPFTRRQAWQDLILTSNHKDWQIVVRWNYITIKRGQNWYSEETFAKRRQWSRGKVRRYLSYLETVQQIVQQKSKLKTIITIVNREKYQWNGTTDSTTDGHQTVQQTDTNKKDNNIKKKKETIDAPPSVDLENLWKVFPHARKAKKTETLKYLAKLDYDICFDAIKILRWEVELWLQDIKFIPGMALRARDFVPLADAVKQKKLLSIYKIIKEGDNIKEMILRFTTDFGEEKTKALYTILEKQKKDKFISSIYTNGN